MMALDLESEAMRGLGSIPTGDNILPLEFFGHNWHFCAYVKNPTAIHSRRTTAQAL